MAKWYVDVVEQRRYKVEIEADTEDQAETAAYYLWEESTLYDTGKLAEIDFDHAMAWEVD